ncbi:MAG: Hpt domain-containing protein [Planctomycetota bacterium]
MSSPDPASASSGDGLPVLDWGIACRVIPGGATGIAKVVEIMLDDSPKRLDEVRRGLSEHDAKKTRMGAHTLQGAARHFGAQRVISIAMEVETAAAKDDLDTCRAALPRLESALDELNDALANVKPADFEPFLTR